MNIIEAMQVWRYDLPYGTGGQQEYIDAAIKIDHILAEYLALKPDWTEAPGWAQWCVIHANGLQYWMDEANPFTGDGAIGWESRGNRPDEFYRMTTLPLGIDWRLCKWQRP